METITLTLNPILLVLILTLTAILFALCARFIKNRPKLIDIESACIRIKKRGEISPYCMEISNSSDISQKAILFGHHRYNFDSNHGSDQAIKISSFNNISYSHILNESACLPFRLCLMRIIMENADEYSKHNSVIHVRTAGNGRQWTTPIKLKDHFLEDQYQKDIVDVTYNLLITGRDHLEFNVPPQSTMHVSIFPSKQFSIYKALSQIEDHGFDDIDPSVISGVRTARR